MDSKRLDESYKPLRLCAECLMNECNGKRSLAYSGSDSLHAACSHVSRREDTGDVRFKQVRSA
jgi:hypothetical protein